MPLPRAFRLSLPSGVRPIAGEPLRFFVQSRSRGQLEHLVDLEENGFNGQCSCEFYQFKLWPKIRDMTEEQTTMRVRCRHIKRAMYYLAELTMRAMAQSNKKRQP